MTVHSLEHQSYEGPGPVAVAELLARQPDLAPAEAALFGLLDALAV